MTAPYLDPRDAEYAQTLPADERDTVLATVTRFRRPDRLRVGDALPDRSSFSASTTARRYRLESLVTGRVPLVLVFGSFT